MAERNSTQASGWRGWDSVADGKCCGRLVPESASRCGEVVDPDGCERDRLELDESEVGLAVIVASRTRERF